MEERHRLSDDKVMQRNAALAARRKISLEQRTIWERNVCSLLAAMPEVCRAKVILSYMASAEELSLRRFHEWACRAGKTLAFPVSGTGGKMAAFVPAGPGGMRKGMFGITEPEPDKSSLLRPEDVELVLVPCVAFDEDGGRLGYGGGYYDRYLPGCARAGKVLIAFEAQRLSRVATDDLDVRMDAVVTEKGIRRIRI